MPQCCDATPRRENNACAKNILQDARSPLIFFYIFIAVSGLACQSVHAAKCAAIDIDSAALSNHGVRQLDDLPAPIEVLPEVVAEYGLIPFLVYGGIGTGVMKAGAPGASATMVGQAVLYGLRRMEKRAQPASLKCRSSKSTRRSRLSALRHAVTFRQDMRSNRGAKAGGPHPARASLSSKIARRARRHGAC